jgi:Mg-chelatase subunit ChlD
MHFLRSAALLTALLGVCATPALAAPVPGARKPQVEVVFCLDTTGSMSGLISAAKAKIWSISNQIASGKPTPALKIGLVAYRDRKDDYITQVFGLTDDLDAVHANLQKFAANGGGDGPESVNQALNEAVTKIKWSKDKKVMKIIFLVGDAPPHMDYPDDVKYPQTCKLAVKQGILINTIQCGTYAAATAPWKEIAAKAEGSYVAIAQNGGPAVAIATPFDKRLAEINTELAKTTLAFGRGKEKAEGEAKADEAAKLPAPAAAARAGYLAKSGTAAAYDLLDSIKSGKVKLEKLKKEELPKELRDKTLAQQKEFLDKLDKRRTKLNKEVLELDKKRSDFIAKKRAEMAKGKKGEKPTFEKEVLDLLRKQAKKYEIAY